MLKRGFIVATLLSSVALFGCPESQTSAAPPPAQTKSTVTPPPAKAAVNANARGRKLFLTACANCHGPDGTGSLMRQAMPKIGNLTSAELHGRMKDADLKTLIKSGRDKMPGFGTMFKDDQIDAIIKYVRTLKRG